VVGADPFACGLNATPSPGVYPNVPAATYHTAWRAASNSQLSKLLRSPAHLKSYLDQPQQDTTALVIGRAVHMAILEPDSFTSTYVGAPKLDMRTKAGKETRALLELEHGPDNVLSANDYDTCIKVRDSVLVHSAAAGLLKGLSHTELSVVWDDVVSGVRCKARFDGLVPEIAGGAIIDIKTTRDASRRAFERSIFSLGYHRQGAFYLQGAAAHGLAVQHYVNIAVEKDGPCAVAVYRISEGAIDAGAEQLTPLLARYHECVTTNTWPGYPDAVQDIALPAYAWGQIDEDLQNLEEAMA
jgi:hypothetical protein